MKTLFTSLMLLMSLTQLFAQVVMYKTDNFTGESVTLTKNWFFQDNWPQYKSWNDQIRSVKVPAGYKVTLWGGGIGQGDKLVIYKDWSEKDPGNKMGGISSIQIESNNTLNTDQTLKINEKIVSSNGKFMAIMQADGNFCVYHYNNEKQGAFVWGSYQTQVKYSLGSNYRLVMQKDGNLCIYNASNAFQWGSYQEGPKRGKNYSLTSGCKLVLTDEGILNITNASGQVIWSNK